MRHPGLRLTDLNENSILFVGSNAGGQNVVQDNNQKLVWVDSTDQMGIGTGTPNTSAILDITSTSAGVLPPRMTTTQRDAISSPAEGLVLYNTSHQTLNYRDSDSWEVLASTKTAARITYEQGATSDPAKNLYGSWTEVMAAFTATDGPVVIYFDSATTNPLTFPTGTYDFQSRATIRGVRDILDVSSLTYVEFDTNVFFKNVNNMRGLGIAVDGTTSPFIFDGTWTYNVINFERCFVSTVNSPFLQLDGGDATLYLIESLVLNNDSIEIVTDNTLNLNLGINTTFGFLTEPLTGTTGTAVIAILTASSITSYTQSNFSGNLSFSIQSRAEYISFNDTNITAVLPNVAEEATVQTAVEAVNQSTNRLIYQQGGTTAGNIYASWSDLMTAFNKTVGPVEIVFDNSVTATMGGIPNSTQDLGGRAILSAPERADGTHVVLQLNTNQRFENVYKIKGNLNIQAVGTTPAIIIDSGTTWVDLILEDGVKFSKTSTGPALQIDGETASIRMEGCRTLDASTIQIVNSGIVNAILVDNCILTNDTFYDDNTGTLNITYSADSNPASQSGINTLTTTLLDAASRVSFDDTNMAFTATDVQTAIEQLGSSYTSGSVLFGDSNGNISQDNSNLFWNDTANALGIGTNSINASTILELDSTTKGFLPPRMTKTQRDALTASDGLMIYNTTQEQLEYYAGQGNVWTPTAFYNPAGFVQYVQDFVGAPADWTNTVANGGGSTSGGNINTPGTRGVTTGGSSAAGRSSFHLGTRSELGLGDGVTMFQWLVQIPTLSTASEEFVLEVGFIDIISGTGAQTDAVCFIYDRATAGDFWRTQTANNNNRTTNTTGTAVTTSWVKLEAIADAAANNVDFFINGTNVGTHTTNIPKTSLRCFNLGILIEKTVGTSSRGCTFDLAACWKWLTTVR